MHFNSMQQMSRIVRTHLNIGRELSILDVGSYNVNGTYKDLFKNPGWRYTGLDITAGPNVDMVVGSEYAWPGIPNESFDVVISGQAFEHMTAPWLAAVEIGRVCKRSGLCVIIAPRRWDCHRFPIDCWRILPDGMLYIMTELAPFTTVECGMIENDTVFVGRKK